MTEAPPTVVPLDRTLDATLGFELEQMSAELAVGTVTVEDRVRQPMGLLHGGVFAALAESLASAATFFAVSGGGEVAVGLSNHTSFVRPVTEGTVRAEARRRHRGRTTWIWEVDFTDDQDRLCAMTRVTMAVRPARPG